MSSMFSHPNRTHPIRYSLQWRLIGTVISVVLAFSLLVADYTAWQSYYQAKRLQDAKLASLVNLAKSHDLTFQQTQGDVNFDYALPLNTDNTTNPTLLFWLTDSRLQTYFAPNVLTNLTDKADGLYDITGKTGKWRVYLFTADPHNTDNNTLTTRLLVAEKADIREQLAWQNAQQILGSLLLLIPILALVLLFIINQLFLPLRTMTEMLQHGTQPMDGQKITDNRLQVLTDPNFIQEMPSEIQPFLHVMQYQIQQLLDSMAMNHRFVANASHQLRTPMTAVLLQAEQLATIAPTDRLYPQKIEELLTSIKRSTHLMNQLLLLAKTDQTSHTNQNALGTVSPFDTSEVIETVLIDCYPLAQQKNIDLAVTELADIKNMAKGLPLNELGFKLIVQNLVENAIKYTPDGGQVEISLTANAQQIRLQVSDTGIGIADSELAKITEPFYRSDSLYHNAEFANTEGFGLGLSIVKNIVSQSRGALTFHNRCATDNKDNQPIQGLIVTVMWQV